MPDLEDLQRLAERVEAGEIKALSIKQPYPHHIFHDGKDVENRDWPTKGRGWVIVHAGVSKSELDMDNPREAAMPRGGVVGMMKITDCVRQMDSRWFFGRYGFVIGEAFPLPLIPCRGQLGFFALPAEVLALTAASLRARIGVRGELLSLAPLEFCLDGLADELGALPCWHDHEAARIAAGLTKAQRDLICASVSGGWFPDGDEDLGWLFRRKSLVRLGVARPGVMYGFSLTPLGHRVRAILSQDKSNG